MKVFVGVLGLVSLLLTGCGGGATVKVQFINATAGARALEEADFSRSLMAFAQDLLRPAPTVFKMKLIAAYITEDIDPTTFNNVGQTSMVYLNNDCQDDIMHCDISEGTAEDGAPMDKIVTTFFNFGQATSAVNAELNAQGRSVSAGAYKYARLEFCKYNSGNSENIQWADGGNIPTGSPRSFKRNSCTVNSAEISPALNIVAGGTVTINISYDLSSAVSTGGSCTGDDDNGGSGAGKSCFTMPTFTPSAS